MLDKETGARRHTHFYDLPSLLRPGDCLVLNDSRVLPARLIGRREPGGGAAEVLLLIDRGEKVWECLVRPGRRLKAGTRLSFGDGALTAQVLGNRVTRLYDVGVAGLHRLLANLEPLMSARCIVAVAGMEGALASVIGGLVDCPVIAVPTSVGYGASFGGLSALLAMLNSCASGCSVVNIDNGFGAGYLASMINQMEGLE